MLGRLVVFFNDTATIEIYTHLRTLSLHDALPLPLAVTRELGEGKEQDERERRWFPFSEAAGAVDEADLQALIRSFGDQGFRAVARSTGVVDNIAQKTGVSRMFAWFQRLLPKQGNFFELFESHAATLAAGAEALARLSQGGEGIADHIQERSDEHTSELKSQMRISYTVLCLNK